MRVSLLNRAKEKGPRRLAVKAELYFAVSESIFGAMCTAVRGVSLISILLMCSAVLQRDAFSPYCTVSERVSVLPTR
jgi:hypothetical protein